MLVEDERVNQRLSGWDFCPWLQVHAARVADVASFLALSSCPIAAYDAHPTGRRMLAEVILGQRSSWFGSCGCPLWPLLRRQLLQQLEHELLAEAQLSRMMRRGRPELEGIDDAHIQQPPG